MIMFQDIHETMAYFSTKIKTILRNKLKLYLFLV